MRYYGNSDVGRRRANNQDRYAVKEYECGAVLGVVCDGMGGAHGGETASATAVKTYVDVIDRFMASIVPGARRPDKNKIAEALVDAVLRANAEVYNLAARDESLAGMGTTLVSSLVIGNRIYTVNVGDSRMYLIDSGNIVQVTHDHSYVQYLVDIGKMTSEEAETSLNKNIITRAVGTDDETEPDVYLTEIKKSGGGIHILLCTDGLSNHVTKDAICETVVTDDGSEDFSKRAVDALIAGANENGGNDNITVVLISL